MNLDVVGMKLDDVQKMAAHLGRHPAVIRITRPPDLASTTKGVLRVVAVRQDASHGWVLVCAREMSGAKPSDQREGDPAAP